VALVVVKPMRHQRAQEGQPERAVLARPEVEPQHFALPVTRTPIAMTTASDTTRPSGRMYHPNQRSFSASSRVQHAREVAAIPNSWDPQLERADPRIPLPLAIPVALLGPLRRPTSSRSRR
jgi:hypothetical protein